MKIFITGATGFIGRELVWALKKRGHEITVLARDMESVKRVFGPIHALECILPERVPPLDRSSAGSVLIHAAFTTRFADPNSARETNVDGTERIFAAARAAGFSSLVFISSMSSHDDAASHYGQHKRWIEKQMDLKKDLIIRPGFVVGKDGLSKRVMDSLGRFPVVPLFYGGKQQIQTIGLTDLVEAIVTAVENHCVGELNIAHPQALTLRKFYRILAGRPVWFLNLPGAPFLFLFRFLEMCGLKLPITSDNVLGQKKLKIFDVAKSLEILKISPKSLEENIDALGRE